MNFNASQTRIIENLLKAEKGSLENAMKSPHTQSYARDEALKNINLALATIADKQPKVIATYYCDYCEMININDYLYPETLPAIKGSSETAKRIRENNDLIKKSFAKKGKSVKVFSGYYYIVNQENELLVIEHNEDFDSPDKWIIKEYNNKWNSDLFPTKREALKSALS